MKWTVLVKSHFTQAKDAPRAVAVSRVDGMKWSQVSRVGEGACGWHCEISVPMGAHTVYKSDKSKLKAVDFLTFSPQTLACIWLLHL